MVRESISKLGDLESYQISYDYSMTMQPVMDMGGEMTIYRDGESTRTDMEMPFMLGMILKVSNFELPSGSFSCMDLAGNITCTEGERENVMPLDPDSHLSAMDSLLEKGIVSLAFLNAGTSAGRACYNVSSSVDLSRLSLLDEEDLFALGLNSSMVGEMGGIESLTITECYDAETGMPLDTSTSIRVDFGELVPGTGIEELTLCMDLRATSFEPGKDIPEQVFGLPAEVTEGDAGMLDISGMV